MSDERAYFFGAVGGAGHYLFDRSLHHVRGNPTPWPTADLDPPVHAGPWSPRATVEARDVWLGSHDSVQTQGLARISHRNDLTGTRWTRIGWADRSVDNRNGSHANVIARGDFTFDEMLSLAHRVFPSVMARMAYEIRRV